MSDTAQEKQWYIARDGQQHGPLTDPEMQLFVTGKHLQPNDLVWRPGFTDWQPASALFALNQEAEKPEPKPEPAVTPPATETPATAAVTPSVTGSANNPSQRSTQGSASGATENLSARSPYDSMPKSAHQTPASHSSSLSAALTQKTGQDTPTNTTTPQQTTERPVGTGQGSDPTAGLKPGGGGLTSQPGTSGASLTNGPSLQQHRPTRADPGVGAGERQQQPSLSSGAPGNGGRSAPGSRGPGTGPGIGVGPLGGAGPSILRADQGQRNAPLNAPRGELRTQPGHAQAATQRPRSQQQMGAPPPGSGGTGSTKRNTAGRIFTTVAALAFVGGGAYLGYQNRVQLADVAMSMMPAKSDTASGSPPPVVAANKQTKSAAGAKPIIGNEATIARLDTQFQTSPLWSLLKSEYPEWYNARLKQVLELNAAGDDPEVTKRLLTEIVSLRRKHSKDALAASTGKLVAIATAFLGNLKRLSEHSTDACYMFISKGDLSPQVINLMTQKSYGPALETQATAIFEAISDGRRSPVKRERANKEDYNFLAKQLSTMGWTSKDLQLFANPTALAKAPHARVCQMVSDWFAAHIAIADPAIKERLLFETLRPVVAG